MPIERLNGAIRAHVVSCISLTAVTAFVLRYSLLSHVAAALCSVLCAGTYRAWMSEPSSRSVEADVALLLEWLRRVVGADWAQATRRNTSCHVIVGSDRAPWLVQRDAMRGDAATTAYWRQVQEYVLRLAPWQVWTP